MRPPRPKVTPRVVRGRVQRKNRTALSPQYYHTPERLPIIDRKRPGPGHRHVLTKRDIRKFISILPDWAELARGLRVIVLAPRDPGADGWHRYGIVAVCAWNRALWQEWRVDHYEEHREILEWLEVPCEPVEDAVLCKFTETSVRGYQLLHILLHEFGHHHDRMTTRHRVSPARGESYAERYARQYELTIRARYREVFGWP